MTIKETLIEANRYEEVVNILESIIKDDQASYPLFGAFINQAGETRWRVEGEATRNEAKVILQLINDEIKYEKLENKNVENIHKFVNGTVEIRLYNYANEISHRKEPDENDIEIIRQYQVLLTVIEYFHFDFINDPDFGEFEIPKGWKGENKYCKWKLDYTDSDGRKRFKAGCTNFMTYPKLGMYCPVCGKEIKIQ